MHELIQFAEHYWWLVFVFGGSGGGWRIRRQLRIRGSSRRTSHEIAPVEQRPSLDAAAKVIAQHDDIDRRWFAYETDLATLLDYPMMIDMRETLTAQFHSAKSRADLVRPSSAQELTKNAETLERYRKAVHDYVVAFDVAEAEARRRRRGGFTPDEQERLARAQRMLALAMNEGATAAERQTAYQKLQREVEGLIRIPPLAQTAIEQVVMRAIGSAER